MLSPTTVHVAVRPFHDRALTRDSALLHERLAPFLEGTASDTTECAPPRRMLGSPPSTN